MKPRDLVLAVLVAAVWGVNFVALHVGLATLPPLLFSALRFGLVALLVLVVGRPRVAWRWVLAGGLALGVVKFSLLFFAMNAGLPTGLSSVLLQSQAAFTVVFAMLTLRERPSRRQYVGLGLAAVGIAVVGLRVGTSLPPVAFALILGAGAAWGVSNVVTRKASPPDALNFLVWVSAVAAGPLLVLSLLVEGPAKDLAALRAMGWDTVGALAYVVVVSTVFGFGAWGMLIKRYSASTVAPFSMLVPFFGMASAVLVLGERPHATDLLGGALVVGGVLWGAVKRRGAGSSSPTPRSAEPAPPVLSGTR